MKTYKNLWDKFISKENFELAYKNSIKRKSKQKQIQEFQKDLNNNLGAVRQLVISGNFHTSKYRSQTIYEPKERIIYKLPYNPDRIVQHAVMNILKPILLNLFIENILSNMFHRIIKDKKFMIIIDDIIFSFPGNKNCPIGNYCSQWFGNFYLSILDNFILHKLKCKAYLRYCDDFILYDNDKSYLHKCKYQIKIFLYNNLLLVFSKSQIGQTKYGVDFCGYRCFKKYVLLRKSTAKRIQKRFISIKYLIKTNNFDKLRVQGQIASAEGQLKHCCSYNFRKSLDIYTLKLAINNV